MINLKNKKVLITGATGGIGNCLVEKFYNLGANIVATGTNDEKLANIKNKFNNVHIEKFNLEIRNWEEALEDYLIRQKINPSEIQK